MNVVEEPAARLIVGGTTLTEMTVTVKFAPLLASPPTVTTTLPVVAPIGTGAMMRVGLQNVVAVNIPPNETVLEPCVVPKPAPLIDTEVPTAPDAGLRVIMTGTFVTVKVTPLLANPPAVTTTFPVEAPAGTETEMLVGVQLIPEFTSTPLKETVPNVAPKFAPVIVTGIPTGPEAGLKLVMLGVKTVNATLLLDTPPTVTTTIPVVAPDGTVATMLVALQLVASPAETPPNVTALEPCDVPKFVPVIVTEAPTGPAAGLKLVMVGGAPPPPPTVLNAARPAPQLALAENIAVAATPPAVP